MSKEERELLLLVVRWCYRLESSAAPDEEKQSHPGLKRLRELIAAIEIGRKR